jgi:outer membrane protein OmpA-like peptidoglycan-associated protein
MMRARIGLVAWVAWAACGGTTTPAASSEPATGASGAGADVAGANQFQIHESGTVARDAHGERPSQISPTATEAAVKLFVVDRDAGPVQGVVVVLTDPDGRKHYTAETDSAGYTELLLPIGKRYEMVYLSLGRRDIAAAVDVPNEARLSLRLTLRFARWVPPVQPEGPAQTPPESPRFVLNGVEFETGSTTLGAGSRERLADVVEFMTHKRSARIEISGHTDNVGDATANMGLSERRAQAVRDYLVSQGIDGGRIQAVGYGDTLPLAPNDTDDGRQRNRRIEATEL